MPLSITAIAQSRSADSTKNKTPAIQAVQKNTNLEIYGFILTDVIYDFKQMDPKWYDVPRPTKLPAYKNQFGPDGQLYFSMRQTRFGLKSYVPTPLGPLSTLFEFDLFGSGVDAGQTTFHLRHAYGELGKVGVGQTWSPFVDTDVFPNDLELWGPNGMAVIRSLQVRYMPIQGDTKLTIALEKPGGTADEGVYADMVELKNVKPVFRLPDLTAEYRYGRPWGYVELAGILKLLQWKDLDTSGIDYSGKRTGWGLNLSSKIKLFKQDAIHLQLLYGKGIESYVRDAPSDVGVKKEGNNPIEGVALPVTGFVGFYDHYWNKKLSSTIGYSSVKIDNSNGQLPSAFKKGEYAITDLIYSPIKDVFLEIELQYLKRKNYGDGWTTTDPRIQFSFKFNFSQKFYYETNTAP
ncbi:DcaP family trimeric outer membrane transporter [Pinibacter sp. MAH-24]|uniref:DcaP family trimeric outer membrane transporter n=2 Tax=Pinibacter soli TaxID=3044211 RepID=A0ABT6RFD0_9BACT|nr:DcaP family trimeric outer membrane transporter [Pinibacter soli]